MYGPHLTAQQGQPVFQAAVQSPNPPAQVQAGWGGQPQTAGYPPAPYQQPVQQQILFYQPYQVMTPQGMQTVIYYPVAEEKKDGPGRKVWRIIYPLLAFFGLQLFAGIIAVVFMLASYSYTGALSWMDVEGLVWEVLAISAVADVIMIPLCIAFMRMDENRKAKLGTLVKYTRVRVLPCIAGLVIGIAMAFLAIGCFSVFGQLDMQAQYESYAPFAVLAFLIIGVLAPVTEELLFRVVIYTRLRESLTPVSAGLICALIFALAHGSAIQGVTAFFYGLALCLVYERWKSYVPALLMHMGVNCTVITVAIVSGGSSAFFEGAPLAGVLVVGALVLIGCILYVCKSKPAQVSG